MAIKNAPVDLGPRIMDDCVRYIFHQVSGGDVGCDCTGKCRKYKSFDRMPEEGRDGFVSECLGPKVPDLNRGRSRWVKPASSQIYSALDFDDTSVYGHRGSSRILCSSTASLRRKPVKEDSFESFEAYVDMGIVLRFEPRDIINEDSPHYVEKVVGQVDAHLDYDNRVN